MRPILHGDITAAAKVLLGYPEALRAERFGRMLMQAEAADAYRKRHGRWHPFWGNGSLMTAAQPVPIRSEPYLDDVAYCACLAMIFEALVVWRCEKAAFNRSRKICTLRPSDQSSVV